MPDKDYIGIQPSGVHVRKDSPLSPPRGNEVSPDAVGGGGGGEKRRKCELKQKMKDKGRPEVKMVMLNGQKNKGKKGKRGENITGRDKILI